MEFQSTVHFLSLKGYDKKDKATGNKTGQRGNILTVLEFNAEGNAVVSTFFPSNDQIKTIGGAANLQFMDKVNMVLDLGSASSKPFFVSLGDVVERATVTYTPINKR